MALFGCHARCQQAHQEQFWVQYLAQGHFDMHIRRIEPVTSAGSTPEPQLSTVTTAKAGYSKEYKEQQ